MRSAHVVIWLVAVAVCLGGCATTGGGTDMQNAVFETYRISRNLDRNLSGSVTKLNETAAELVARVDETDRQARQLQTVAEDNRIRLQAIEQKLDSLTTTLYQHLNLTPPRPSASSSVDLGPIRVTPGGSQGTAGPEVETPPANAVAAPSPIPPGPNRGAETASPSGAFAEYQSAYNSVKEDKHELAVRQFEDFLRRYPNNPEYTHQALFWKAKCHNWLGEYDKAILDYQKLWTSFPNSKFVSFAMHNQAMAHTELGQTAQAIQLLEKLVREFPNDPAAVAAEDKLKELRAGVGSP